MASIGSQEDAESSHNLKKVSQLESQVDALTQENSELFVLLQNERRKSKKLQSELDLSNVYEESAYQASVEEAAMETSKEFLQNVVVMLKEQFDTKESECEDLEQKLSLMNQELVAQSEEHARSTLEFQHQMKHLHELLTQERDLNNVLSEESDQTVRELEKRLQEKDNTNTELKIIQNETVEKMKSLEDECCLYQAKLNDTERSLRNTISEHEKQVIGRQSVSCQVSESELQALENSEALENNTFYEIFRALWGKGDIEVNGVTKYTMNIFNLIQNGFKSLGGNVIALRSIRKREPHNCDCISNF